jgi:hypothetical protein
MDECIICFEETADFSFYRCAHKVCNNCYAKLNKCPICNTPRESEIIIIRPQIEQAGQVITTYNFIKLIGSFLLLSSLTFYFYKH